MTRRPDLMALAEAERTDLVALLQSLTADQWAAQSLCTQWTVRDVALHLVSYDELSKLALVATFLRGGVQVNPVNDVALRRYQDIRPDDIIDLLARNLRPRGLTSGFKGGIALTDAPSTTRTSDAHSICPGPSPWTGWYPSSTSPPAHTPCRPRTTSRA